MASVTQRIAAIKQPLGGYISSKLFEKIQLEDDETLAEIENIHGCYIGMVVDYLTRWQNGTNLTDAFKISLSGALLIDQQDNAIKLLKQIQGLDDNSIKCACQLTGYDVCYRRTCVNFRPVFLIRPDEQTLNNIRIMVKRSLNFFKNYGPVILDGFTLDGAYTKIITTGDGDFVTNDTLWDFKVAKNPLTSKTSLQLLIYYLMGKKSKHSNIFKKLKYLGLYNPRTNLIYRININHLDQTMISHVMTNVIGYDNK